MSIEIILVIIVVFLLLIIITRRSCDPYLHHCERAVSRLDSRLFFLEKENERLNHIVRNLESEKRNFKESFAAHCYSCERIFIKK